MPYQDRDQANAAKQRSRTRELAEGRCIRCPRFNDAPEINARLCSYCRIKDSEEKKAARARAKKEREELQALALQQAEALQRLVKKR